MLQQQSEAFQRPWIPEVRSHKCQIRVYRNNLILVLAFHVTLLYSVLVCYLWNSYDFVGVSH